jgi:hypothetical protein
LDDAEVVIAFENQLVSILNFTGPWDIEDELQNLAEGFGYYFEMGNHWNLGFYRIDKVEVLPPRSTPYRQLLQHPRWLAKRQRILKRSQGRCEQCGAKLPQQVHHCYYRYGRYPWQYPDGALLSLCKDCHPLREKTEMRLRMFLTRLKIESLEQMRRDYRDKVSQLM